MLETMDRELDPTPPRPPDLPELPFTLCVAVRVRVAHLANPVVAIGRLLTSEGNLCARVTGDDGDLEIEVALPGDDPVVRSDAEAWVRWATHCAGVRGDFTLVSK